jgi:hypothetical protein
VPLASPPYRLDSPQVSDAAVQARNQTEGRKGTRAFRQAAEAVREVRAPKKSLSESRLSLWLAHPDERVLIELAGKREPSPWDIGWAPLTTRPGRKARFQAEVEARAEHEGLLWSPLLDAFYASPYAEYTSAEDYLPDAPLRSHALQRRLERLSEWVAGQSDPAAVLPLLGVRVAAVRQAVARSIRCLEDGVLEAVLGAPGVAEALAENPHLDEAHVQRLIRWAGRELCKAGWPGVDVRQGEDQRWWAERSARRTGARFDEQGAADALIRLQARGVRLGGPEAWDALLDQVTPWSPDEKGLAVAAPMFGSRRHAFDVLVADQSQTPPGVLFRVLERIAHEPAQIARVARCRNASLPLLRKLAEERKELVVRQALAASPMLREDEVARAAVLRRGAATVLMTLAEQAEGEEFADLFRRIFQGSEMSALRLAQERFGSGLERLPEEIWPILEGAQRPGALVLLAQAAGGERRRRFLARLIERHASDAHSHLAGRPELLDSLHATDFPPLERPAEADSNEAPSASSAASPAPAPSSGPRSVDPVQVAELSRWRATLHLFALWAVRHAPPAFVRAVEMAAEEDDLLLFQGADFEPFHRSSDAAARGDGYRRVFRRLAQLHPLLALEFLGDVPEPKLSALSGADLAPLLASGHSEIRLAALRAMRPGMQGAEARFQAGSPLRPASRGSVAPTPAARPRTGSR